MMTAAFVTYPIFWCYLLGFLAFHSIRQCRAQYNFCLMPPGCKGDECCYSIVAQFRHFCHRIPSCSKPFYGDCCLNSRVVQLNSGYIYGSAQYLDDTYGYSDNGNRYLNTFLGVRYAKPPSRELDLRFKKPQPLENSQEKILAMEYGPSCPQDPKHLKQLVNPVMSEDCLNMNIFVMNDTQIKRGLRNLYPIMVFFHGGEHKYGSASLHPGHVLGQVGIMVITVNYRLGVFGFMSTEDENAQGNYGLWDQLAALQFIKDNGEKFAGDVTRITLVGHDTGAADVALQMMRMGNPLFHRAIWMSGSDQMVGGFVTQQGEAKRFTEEIAVQIGCSNINSKALVDCLSKREFNELATAAEKVTVQGKNWKSLPWSPRVDKDFIHDYPVNLRRLGLFQRMRVIGGLTEGDGSFVVEEIYKNYTTGEINIDQMSRLINAMLEEDAALDRLGSLNNLLFEYTYWPQPRNDTRRLKKLVELWTDRRIGTGLDDSLKSQCDAPPYRNWTQMYLFKYKSAADPKCKLFGAYHGSELQYLFGLAYLNNSDWAHVGLHQPNFYYERLDMNMTDYMIYMFSNFVVHGNATPDVIRNLTWDTYRPNNRTYFELDLHNEFEPDFELRQDYRVFKYGFWRFMYDRVLGRMPRFSTPFPTPMYLSTLKVSSFSLTGILVVALLLLAILTIVLLRKRRQLR